MSDSVIFTGSVPWDEVPAYTDAGDVFAMPCRTRLLGLEPEAFGIVFLEAQACGLPVLAGPSGGVHETLIDGTTGVVLRGGGHVNVSDTLVDILKARSEERNARRRTCVTWATGWDWRVSAGNLQSLLGESQP